ncbi:glycogen-binding domain-containing protein [Candidatus Fermentibacteria bacterium]|nr:glycogen-binding domain-containing protein [Candidatus Fermentibacteria bacterium]
MKGSKEHVHRMLDGDPAASAELSPDQTEELATYAKALRGLETARVSVPPGFTERVMAVLPESIDVPWGERIRSLWPGQGRWVIPAVAGAMATVLCAFGVPLITGGTNRPVEVTFELHAPDARSVELIGSFNGWRRGEAALQGPDATGHWSVTVPLDPGRHEYLFVIDDRQMVPDPSASLYRPDGFGRTNAVIDI